MLGPYARALGATFSDISLIQDHSVRSIRKSGAWVIRLIPIAVKNKSVAEAANARLLVEKENCGNLVNLNSASNTKKFENPFVFLFFSYTFLIIMQPFSTLHLRVHARRSS